MGTFSHGYADLGMLIARLGFGLGFVWYHGLPKLMGGNERLEGTGSAVSAFGIESGHYWWGLAAALVETAGGLLVATGLFFRPTVLALAVVMIVASVNAFAGQGNPAHSVKNAWLFAGLILVGPGRYSVDDWMARRRR